MILIKYKSSIQLSTYLLHSSIIKISYGYARKKTRQCAYNKKEKKTIDHTGEQRLLNMKTVISQPKNHHWRKKNYRNEPIQAYTLHQSLSEGLKSIKDERRPTS